MKKIFAFATCMLAAVALFAQPHNPGGSCEENRKKEMERIQSEKIAFFTSELDLTPEEAQVFWPVYNQYWKDAQSAHKATMKAFGAINGQKGETLTDNEIESRVAAYIAAVKAEQELMTNYYPKFKKVLPIKKVAKLYEAEEAFRMKMIHKLRGPKSGHQGGPQGGPQATGMKKPGRNELKAREHGGQVAEN